MQRRTFQGRCIQARNRVEVENGRGVIEEKRKRNLEGDCQWPECQSVRNQEQTQTYARAHKRNALKHANVRQCNTGLPLIFWFEILGVLGDFRRKFTSFLGENHMPNENFFIPYTSFSCLIIQSNTRNYNRFTQRQLYSRGISSKTICTQLNLFVKMIKDRRISPRHNSRCPNTFTP